MSLLSFSPGQVQQSQKIIRGLREASIPVADANAAIGTHRIQFIDRYQFGFFASPDVNSPAQFGSLIHGGISSRGIMQGATAGGYAAYFGALATDPTSEDDETKVAVNSPPDVAGQPVQNPFLGCNKVSACLWVCDTVTPESTKFTLSLYRAVTPIDAVTYMGNPTIQSLLVAQWGPVNSNAGDNPYPTFDFTDVRLQVATSFWFELKSSDNGNLNALAGSIFFHG